MNFNSMQNMAKFLRAELKRAGLKRETPLTRSKFFSFLIIHSEIVPKQLSQEAVPEGTSTKV